MKENSGGVTGFTREAAEGGGGGERERERDHAYFWGGGGGGGENVRNILYSLAELVVGETACTIQIITTTETMATTLF